MYEGNIDMNTKIQNQNRLVKEAIDGDVDSLETLVLEIKDLIFNLSVKMLFSREDAEDATQDILIKVIQNLKQFKGQSKFTTWVFSIARNHLLSARKKRAENQEVSFEIMSNDLNVDLTSYKNNDTVNSDFQIADLKIGCTQAMLLCLDREKRMIFILSRMFNINSIEGAKILDITAQTYRKRLSRINDKMKNFVTQNCGLVNENAKCRCKNRLLYAASMNRINPNKPYFVDDIVDKKEVKHILSTMNELEDACDIFKTNPYYEFDILKIQKIINKIEHISNKGVTLS